MIASPDSRPTRQERRVAALELGGIGPNATGTHAPPPGCIAFRYACPVLGPCDRHLSGNPCLVADTAQEEAAA